MTNSDPYVTDEAHGENWTLMLGDSCERLSEIGSNTVDLSVSSPPFASLFTYSPSVRDLGNSSTRGEFLSHYGYIIREQLRVTKPGRLACIHVQQLTTTKSMAGYMGMTDFRGEVIRAFESGGWYFNGEVTVWKDPQAQSIRTRSHALAFATKNRDSASTRPALADYLLLFRKPGDNAVKIPHHAREGEVTNDDWIEWAGPIWFDHTGDIGGEKYGPVWTTIRESETLNARAGRENADERHIAPLQLEFIRRCILLYSNPGELVLSPFGGIGSEPYVAVKNGRRAVSCELKPSYWESAVNVMRDLDYQMSLPTLMDDLA